MKRALIVSAGTIVGVAAVLALNPDGSSAAVSAHAIGTPSGSGTSTGTSTGTSGTASGPSAAPSSSPSGSGGSTAPTTSKATGDAIDVGYGMVQVEVTVSNGKITDISALQLPQNDGHSARISQQAWPMLVQEAISAQSSQISGVSGASYTSYGFAQSLKAALVSVGHAA